MHALSNRTRTEHDPRWATFVVTCLLFADHATRRVITDAIRAVSELQARTVFSLTHPELADQDRLVIASKKGETVVCAGCGHHDHNTMTIGLPCPNCGETIEADD